MKRLEIIANQSVHDELIDELERSLPEMEYTLLPLVHGKGRRKRKLGTRTWPETNFLLICYMDEVCAEKASAAVSSLARRFPDEGIFAAIAEVSLI
jgi:hypothetical protein